MKIILHVNQSKDSHFTLWFKILTMHFGVSTFLIKSTALEFSRTLPSGTRLHQSGLDFTDFSRPEHIWAKCSWQYSRPARCWMSCGCAAGGCGDCCFGLVTLVLLLANSRRRVCGRSGSNRTPCCTRESAGEKFVWAHKLPADPTGPCNVNLSPWSEASEFESGAKVPGWEMPQVKYRYHNTTFENVQANVKTPYLKVLLRGFSGDSWAERHKSNGLKRRSSSQIITCVWLRDAPCGYTWTPLGPTACIEVAQLRKGRTFRKKTKLARKSSK